MNEIGNKYNLLTILEDTGKRYRGLVIYKCRCDCGNIVEVNINKLHTGHTKSCGCLNHKIKDYTGRRFGKVTVVSFKGRENHHTLWNCKCDCGNEFVTYTNLLTTGAVVSCGCVNAKNKADIFNRNKGFVNGTNIYSIKENRPFNKNNTSGYTGISWSKEKKKWCAQICFQRKNYRLGYFDKLDDAVKARKGAEIEFFGQYRKK